MSNPCDFGMCDVEKCSDIECESDMRIDPSPTPVKAYIIEDGTKAMIFDQDGELFEHYSVSRGSKQIKQECVKLHLRDLGISNENIHAVT